MTLRSDNADLRLTKLARVCGAVSDERWEHLRRTEAMLAEAISTLRSCTLTPQVRFLDVLPVTSVDYRQ